jgi:hypothetical protein
LSRKCKLIIKITHQTFTLNIYFQIGGAESDTDLDVGLELSNKYSLTPGLPYQLPGKELLLGKRVSVCMLHVAKH